MSAGKPSVTNSYRIQSTRYSTFSVCRKRPRKCRGFNLIKSVLRFDCADVLFSCWEIVFILFISRGFNSYRSRQVFKRLALQGKSKARMERVFSILLQIDTYNRATYKNMNILENIYEMVHILFVAHPVVNICVGTLYKSQSRSW